MRDPRRHPDRRFDARRRGVTCLNHTVIAESTIGDDAHVGPFAHIRPGTALGARCARRQLRRAEEVHSSAHGTKASHLSYLGDATIGAGVNIGAGTITCNYDGAAKHHTVDRRRRLRRQQLDAGRAGDGRRRRLRRGRLGHHRGRPGRRTGHRPRAAGEQGRWATGPGDGGQRTTLDQ